MPAKTFVDFGTVYSKTGPTNSGAGLTNNTYVAGSQFGAGLCEQVSVSLLLTLSGATGYTVKLQGSIDGTTWNDLQSTDNSAGTTAIEHSYTSSTLNDVLQTANCAGMSCGVRVSVKATGGATASGDTAVFKATGFQVAA